MPFPFDSARTRAILLDIEGTTTPIRFVHQTLFTFAAAHAEEFLAAHLAEPEVGGLVDDLRQQQRTEAASDRGPEIPQDAPASDVARTAASYVQRLIARDSKLTALKALQGMIWEAGYRSGALRGEVYPDVAPALARWRAQGRRVAIFSSGSVLAQKLLFTFSTAGNLSEFIDEYFDTTTGPKREAQSYMHIAAKLGVPCADVLFFSDVVAELDAAAAAGMQTALMLRDDAPALAPAHSATPAYAAVRDFADIFPS